MQNNSTTEIDQTSGFSIVIVSWNNKASLERTIKSILKNSELKHEILVHLNEGTDGSKEMLKEMNLTFTISNQNIGLCYGANYASSYATKDWICLMDDDMYVLPKWDSNLLRFYEQNLKGKIVWLSSTMIEPQPGPTVIGPVKFENEESFLDQYSKYLNVLPSVITTQATPVILQREIWKKVGGYNIEYSPGVGSDDEICKNLWDIGCRNFVNVPDSLVYHFQSQTTSRINHGENAMRRDKIFFEKHKMSPREFVNRLGRGKKWEIQ